ncbi:hypothetical protein NPIL_496751 [Nephila pilipes]|uniref:Uncharacterized protein n=1 Tax=Nephila pilipes TaxID=299642 RepID=A0A8X6Q333_NEPPI|nr:hypothetical protein NPIL_496751 [Nephila pilipes]
MTNMTTKENEAWVAFKDLVRKYLGNYKDPGYKAIIINMLGKFQMLGYSMSVKIHFLHSHEISQRRTERKVPPRHQRYGAQISRKKGQKRARRLRLDVNTR